MATQNGAAAHARRVPHDAALDVVLHQTTCTIAEAAPVLGMSERLVREAVEDGRIAALRLGRNWRVLCAPLRRQLGIDV